MLHLNNSLEDSLQTLQDLADELLEVSRSSQISKSSDPTCFSDQHESENDEVVNFNKSSVNDHDHDENFIQKTSLEAEVSSTSDYTIICNSAKDNIYEHRRLPKCNNEKKTYLETVDKNSKVQHVADSTKRKISFLYEHNSPMINLKKLLEKKNHQMSNEQAIEIAEKLFFMEGLDRKEIVKHLLKK